MGRKKDVYTPSQRAAFKRLVAVLFLFHSGLSAAEARKRVGNKKQAKKRAKGGGDA